jgi:hypothetical protein
MGKVSHPILEIVVRAVVVADRKWMSTVTKSPIKAGVHSAEGTESEGISRFLRGFQDDFGIRD